ncbi:hypothetical protein EYF80_060761 [Liparis tanakae]|uniref:XRCC4 C-terminal domain-containing protein n=1 Tax=Liparis tanakae TaxID=230148 RepID=A0A4Z2EJW1_9TELE|nr:hypothetical protein EYF80_060761 [Liparis tanakae]
MEEEEEEEEEQEEEQEKSSSSVTSTPGTLNTSHVSSGRSAASPLDDGLKDLTDVAPSRKRRVRHLEAPPVKGAEPPRAQRRSSLDSKKKKFPPEATPSCSPAGAFLLSSRLQPSTFLLLVLQLYGAAASTRLHPPPPASRRLQADQLGTSRPFMGTLGSTNEWKPPGGSGGSQHAARGPPGDGQGTERGPRVETLGSRKRFHPEDARSASI